MPARGWVRRGGRGGGEGRRSCRRCWSQQHGGRRSRNGTGRSSDLPAARDRGKGGKSARRARRAGSTKARSAGRESRAEYWEARGPGCARGQRGTGRESLAMEGRAQSRERGARHGIVTDLRREEGGSRRRRCRRRRGSRCGHAACTNRCHWQRVPQGPLAPPGWPRGRSQIRSTQ